MTDEQIYSAVTEVLADPASQDRDEIKGLTISMLEMNEEEFDNIFERQVLRKGFLNAITGMIYPFLQYVGVLWNTNKAMIAQEHFISNLIRQKIISAIERLPKPSNGAPGLVLFLMEGEEHEIGLLLANFIARDMGWRTYYLGQGVPVYNIQKVIEIVEPDLLMSMFVTPKFSKINNYISGLLEGGDTPMLVSGSKENLQAIEDTELVVKIQSPTIFQEYLGQFTEKEELSKKN